MSADRFWQESFHIFVTGGTAGIARFLAVADTIYNRLDGKGIDDWIETGFKRLPQADKNALLAMLLENYVTKKT
jgi:hypothetical protein